MSTISIRLPESLHNKVKELARQENTSINQLVSSALAEKVSALMTEEYIEDRARRASKYKYNKALLKVADTAADYSDK